MTRKIIYFEGTLQFFLFIERSKEKELWDNISINVGDVSKIAGSAFNTQYSVSTPDTLLGKYIIPMDQR